MDCPINSKPCSNLKTIELSITENGIATSYFICQTCFQQGNIQDFLFMSCKGCGSTLIDIESTKKFGCSECFTTFKSHAIACFNICQQGEKHHGKKPDMLEHLTEDQLRERIAIYVKEEKYELASRCKIIIEQKAKKQNF